MNKRSVLNYKEDDELVRVMVDIGELMNGWIIILPTKCGMCTLLLTKKAYKFLSIISLNKYYLVFCQ